MKKERPIIFSAEMVRALLEGRKTQTRRVLKPQPSGCCKIYCTSGFRFDDKSGNVDDNVTKCPYGQPGDRLWVRETFAIICREINIGCIDESCQDCYGHEIEYKVDTTNKYAGNWPDDCGGGYGVPKWKASIHMPRWASRITLEITRIDVEKLKNISHNNAIAEGMTVELAKQFMLKPGNFGLLSPIVTFQQLWDSIYHNRHDGEYVWAKNPWVWVVEFKVVENKPKI